MDQRHGALESAEIKLWGSWRLPRGRTQGFSRRERFNSWPLAPRAVGPFSCSRLAEGRLRFCSREAQGQAAISPDLSKNPCRIISCYTDISNQLCLLPVSASPSHRGSLTMLPEWQNKWKCPFLQIFTTWTVLGSQLSAAPFLWIIKYQPNFLC